MKQVKFVTLTTEPATVYSNDLILLQYSDETEKTQWLRMDLHL
ncbi:MAG: hypothetical protein P0116_08025 [Candidatus Nitrosocosmicus sp.]|nr:hypothetical protein [Candidatus Nitrosocosmicus sp.]